jgi:phosphatidylglycerol:prolipoprotein diacylglycerol transferase
LIFAALIGGVVGARLDFMLENWSEVETDFFGNLFSGSGLVWYGGAIGGALGAMAWARYRGMLDWGLADLTAPGLAVGYAIGRIGCQLSGDGDYGIAWDGPWAMSYPDGTVPTTEDVHPTPVYETIAMGAVGAGLWRMRDALNQGGLFGVYLIAAGIERFLIEFIRRNDDAFAGLTLAQLLSIGMVAAGAALLWWVARRHGHVRRAAVEPQPAAAP